MTMLREQDSANVNHEKTESEQLQKCSGRILVMGVLAVVFGAIIQIRGSVAKIGTAFDELGVPSTAGLAVIFLVLLVNRIIK